jgi:hypothetical protein
MRPGWASVWDRETAAKRRCTGATRWLLLSSGMACLYAWSRCWRQEAAGWLGLHGCLASPACLAIPNHLTIASCVCPPPLGMCVQPCAGRHADS